MNTFPSKMQFIVIKPVRYVQKSFSFDCYSCFDIFIFCSLIGTNCVQFHLTMSYCLVSKRMGQISFDPLPFEISHHSQMFKQLSKGTNKFLSVCQKTTSFIVKFIRHVVYMCMRNEKIAIIISKKLLSVVNLIEFSAKTVLLVLSKDLVDLHKICYSKRNFL